MSPLLYLLFKKTKNMLKRLLRSPAKLILVLVFVALFVFSFLGGNASRAEAPVLNVDMRELFGIILAVYTLIFLTIAGTGFSTGMSIFKMSDVNIVFTGPFKPMRVLFYGMVQQLGTALLSSIFIVFQYSWLKARYDVGFGGIMVILVGYALVMLTAQMTAMFIYIMTSSKPQLRRKLKLLYYAIPMVYAVWIFINLMNNSGNILPALLDIAYSLPLRLFPVSGWVGTAAYGVLIGDLAPAAIGLILWAVFLSGSLFIMSRTDQDYYEDVLQSTELMFAQQQSAKEGRVSAVGAGKKVKTGKTGLGSGWGASALWSKFRLEDRRSKKFIIGSKDLIFIATSIAFAFFMRKEGIFPGLGFAVYMQVFGISLSGLVQEMTRPYIYLIPEPPLKKLLWGIMNSMPGFYIAGAVICIPIGLMSGAGVVETIFAILVYAGFSFLILSANILTERVFSGWSGKALIIVFYFIFIILLAAPGIAVAVIVGNMSSFLAAISLSSTAAACLILAIWSNLIAFIIAFLCRNILQTANS